MKLNSLDSQITCIEVILQHLEAIKSVIGRMTADAERMSGEILALAAKCVVLRERCGRLETAASAAKTCFRSESPLFQINLSVFLFQRFENERRDHELIIFGIPSIVFEDKIKTASIVAASLGVTLNVSEVTGVFRIPGPLYPLKFTTIATKKNELLTCFHLSSRPIHFYHPLFMIVKQDLSMSSHRRRNVALPVRHRSWLLVIVSETSGCGTSRIFLSS